MASSRAFTYVTLPDRPKYLGHFGRFFLASHNLRLSGALGWCSVRSMKLSLPTAKSMRPSQPWRGVLLAVCLMIAQSAMAAHWGDQINHVTSVDCEVCQIFERVAPPTIEVTRDSTCRFTALSAERQTGVLQLPLKAYDRPPSRGPPR